MKKLFSIGQTHYFGSKWKDRNNQLTYQHSLLQPKNTYSPWNDDQDFQRVYNKAKHNTLVDQYRCYELWSFAQQLDHLEGDILEVGVWRGGTGSILAAASKSAMVYLCDTFEGVVKAGVNDNVYSGGEHSDTSIETVTGLMDELSISNYRILKGIFPEDSEDQVTSKAFKICHIDVDVYDSARDIFEWVWDKIVVGGCVIFDDYGFASCEGITKLVNKLSQKEGRLLVYNINGHGIIIKTK